MKIVKRLVLVLYLLFFTSACSKVGAMVSNTGDFVSKTGDIISGNNNATKQSQNSVAGKEKQALNKTKKPYRPIDSQTPTITVKIHTTRNANLGSNGKPSRIKITLLQLKSAGKFSSSRISALQTNLESTLGVDFISQESVSLLPKKGKTIKIAIDPSAKVLGVFASFKQLNNTIWKTSLNIPNVKSSYDVQVIVDNKKITSYRK